MNGDRPPMVTVHRQLSVLHTDSSDKPAPAAVTRLDNMLAFANDGLMLPEQIWDRQETPKSVDKQFIPDLKFGEGTGSAPPLTWSMAQFIRLAVNLKAGRNLETPQVVADRYKTADSRR